MNVSGEPLLSPFLAARALFALRGDRQVQDILGRRVASFTYGRYALAAAVQSIKPGAVLVPAFVCDTVIDGLKAGGRVHRYYPLAPDLEPDWDWLGANIGDDIAALLLVHYFGFPADLVKARGFCDERGIMLIEDCAHAFLTAALQRDDWESGRPAVGLTGDIAIYSWRKFLPVVDGGALAAADIKSDIRAARNGFGEGCRQLLKWAVFSSGSGVARRLLAGRVSDEAGRGTPSSWGDAQHATWFAFRVLGAELDHLRKQATRRRENYETLRAAMKGIDQVRVLTPGIDARWVPWCLPIIVGDAESRDDLLGTLLGEGIGAWSWPDLPSDVNERGCPDAIRLARSTVCLPVHQDLGRHHMGYIADTIAAWSL